jgi:hypothetical protein
MIKAPVRFHNWVSELQTLVPSPHLETAEFEIQWKKKTRLKTEKPKLSFYIVIMFPQSISL